METILFAGSHAAPLNPARAPLPHSNHLHYIAFILFLCIAVTLFSYCSRSDGLVYWGCRFTISAMLPSFTLRCRAHKQSSDDVDRWNEYINKNRSTRKSIATRTRWNQWKRNLKWRLWNAQSAHHTALIACNRNGAYQPQNAIWIWEFSCSFLGELKRNSNTNENVAHESGGEDDRNVKWKSRSGAELKLEITFAKSDICI